MSIAWFYWQQLWLLSLALAFICCLSFLDDNPRKLLQMGTYYVVEHGFTQKSLICIRDIAACLRQESVFLLVVLVVDLLRRATAVAALSNSLS